MKRVMKQIALAAGVVAAVMAVTFIIAVGTDTPQAKAADILRDGSPYTFTLTKVNAGTASNLNWNIPCTESKDVFLQVSYYQSNLISAGLSNLTFHIVGSADGATFSKTGAGAAGGAAPNNCWDWTVSASVALGTNHVAVTNLAVGACPYLRVQYVTNGADAYMIATNVTFKAWVK